MIGAAWNIYHVINPDADKSLLAFIRSVVQFYLHVDEIVPGSSFWKTKVVCTIAIGQLGVVTGLQDEKNSEEVPSLAAQVEFALFAKNAMLLFVSKSISKPSIPGNDIIYIFVVLVHMMLKNI